MSEIADFYVTLRAVSAPIVTAYAHVAEAGERMTAKIIAANERLILANKAAEESIERLARQAATSAPVVAERTLATGTAAETAAAQTVRANQAVIASNRALQSSADRMAEQLYVQYPAMAVKTQKAASDMEAAMLKAAAANEAVGAAMTGAAASSTASAAKHAALQGGLLGVSSAALGGTGNMKSWQLGVAAAGVAAGAAAAVTTKMAGDFDFNTRKLMTSAGETQESIGIVRDGILDLASKVGESTSDLTAAMFTVSSAAFNGAEGIKVLTAAAEGAKAEGANLQIVADGVTTTLRAYGYAGDDAARVTSKLVAAGAVGKVTFQELTNSLSSVLPVAGSAKVSLDDILGSLATMTTQGMTARQATQNMADAIRHMVAPTQVQAKELGQLGLSAQDLAGMLSEKGLSGTVAHLSQTILEHMGPSGKVLLGAFRQSKDAASGLKQMLAAMPPDARKLADAFLANEISAAKYLKAAKALPAESANLALQFKSAADRAHGFNDVLKAGGPAAQTYQDALRRVMGDATGMNVALMLTGDQLGYVQHAIGQVAAATEDADGHVRGWSTVQSAFNVKVDQAQGAFGALGVAIGQKFLPAATVAMDVVAKVTGWLSRNEAAATVLAVVIGTVLVAALVVATKAVIGFTIALLTNPVVLITMAILALIVAIVLLVKNWDKVWAAIVSVAKTVWSAITGFFSGIAGWVASLPGKILGALSRLGTMLAGLASRAWGAFTNALRIAAQATLNFVKNLPRMIGFALGFLVGMLARLAVIAWNGFTNGIKNAFLATVQFFKELPGNIASFFTGAGTWLKTTGVDILKGLWNGIVDGAQATVQFFIELPGRIWGWVQSAGTWLKTTGVDILKGMWNGIVEGFWAGVQFLADLPKKILDALVDAGRWLIEVGKNVVRGLWNGISSMGGWLRDQVVSFAGGIIDGFMSGFGIFSPSKKTYAIGEYLVAGLAGGITDRAHHAVAAMHGLTASVSEAATDLRMPQITGLDPLAGGGLSLPAVPAGGLSGVSEPGITRIGPVIPSPSQGGQPHQVTNHYTINVAGQVVTWKGLITDIQQALLRHNSRNVGNGTSFVTT